MNVRLELGEFGLILLLLILLATAIHPAPVNKVLKQINSTLNTYGPDGD